jgi:predicted nucleic acid-binding protein
MAFVLDASVTMRWLTKDGNLADLAYANSILDKFLDPDMQVYAPSHWPLEVTNVMVRAIRLGHVDDATSETFLEIINLAPLIIDLETAGHAFTSTLNLARHYRLTPYDAAYLELALRLDCPLATLDKDLRSAAEKAGLKVL